MRTGANDDESDAEEEGESAEEKAYEAGEEGTPPAADYAAVHLKGEGLQDSPRAPLNELSANRSVPSTPMLKTKTKLLATPDLLDRQRPNSPSLCLN